MKKSKAIVLATIFTSTVVACNDANDEWISGNQNGVYKDTIVNRMPYRYYHGYWYPVYHNQINPGMYSGGSYDEISSPSYHASVRTGGFGESAHSSSVGE